MFALKRRGLPAVAALAAVAAAAGGLAVPAAAAPARHAKADPTITILTSGDRTSSANGSTSATGGTVTGVAGVVYHVTGPGGFSGDCTSVSDGACVVTVPAGGSYTITQVSAPTGSSTSQDNYFLSPVLGTGVTGSIAASPYDTLTVTVPASGNVDVPAGTTSTANVTVRSGRWAVSRYNPPPPTTCTRSVALLFDLSASITAPDLATYKASAEHFVRALEGSSTDVTLYTFGTAGSLPGGNATFGPVSTATPAGVSTLVTRISGLTLPATAQYTNWDAGLWQIAASGAHYDEAIVLTDGDPTAMGSTGAPDATGVATTRFRAVENGIFSANALKAMGTRVDAVGIANNDSAGSVANLKAISGPEEGKDYFIIPFDSLEGLLTDIALGSCASLSIVKSAAPATYDHVGEVIHYTYTVRNTSPSDGFPLHAITVHDDKLGTITDCSPRILAPGEEAICHATHVITQADLDAGHILNSATATGETPGGDEVRSPPDDQIVTAVHYPAIRVTKAASPRTYAAAGQAITYTYHITNTGNVTLTDVRMTDNKIPGPFTCTPAMGSTLAPGESMTCTATYTTTAADVDAGSVKNRVTATGHPPDSLRPVEDHADEEVPAANRPDIEITKEASPQRYDAPGQTIHYTFVVTNVGNVTLHDITVHDSRFGPITCPRTTLASGASMTCHATHVTTQADVDAGSIANTATVTGHPPSGPAVTDEADQEVTGGQGPAIKITKTASPTVYSTHGQVITYTYVVANTGNVTLRDITLTDTRYGTITCPRRTLAPGASMTCYTTHTITATDLDEGSIFDSAAAVGRPPDGRPVESAPAHAIVTAVVVLVPVTG